jgi:hypothetical protein
MGNACRRFACRVFFASMTACGGSRPAPQTLPSAPPPAQSAEPQPPSAESVDSGKDCVTAKARCGAGVCNVSIENRCDQPVRCALEVSAACDSPTGMNDGVGREHDTFAAGSTGDLATRAACTGGPIVHTEVRTLSCK